MVKLVLSQRVAAVRKRPQLGVVVALRPFATVPVQEKVTVCLLGSEESRTPPLHVTCDTETAAAAARGNSHGVGQESQDAAC